MGPCVSVIIPVYNTGTILNDTIKSILNQTFSDFELLLINDGSTDESGILCDKYQKLDSRIKVFHKTNSGICNTRNFAIDNIKGKYVAFCDHDDLYSPNFLEKMVQAAEANCSDIVKCGVKIDFSERNKKYEIKFSNNTTTYKRNELPIHFLELIATEAFESIWNSLFRTEILINSKIKYDETYKHGGEDFDFNIRLYPQIASFTVIPDILYTHIIRTSLSTSAKLYDDILFNFLKQINQINDYTKQFSLLNITDKIIYQYLYVYMRRTSSFILYALKMHKKHNTSIKDGLHLLETNCLLKNRTVSLKYLFIRKDMKSRLCFLLFYILKYQKLNLLYSFLRLFYK